MEIWTIIEMSVCYRTDATAATIAVPAGASMEPFDKRADAPDVVLGREEEKKLRCHSTPRYRMYCKCTIGSRFGRRMTVST